MLIRVLFLWCMCCGVACAADPASQKDHQSEQVKKNSVVVENALRPVGERHEVAEEKQASLTGEPKRDDRYSNEWWIMLWTGALALVTAILALYTYRLWKDASETSKRHATEMSRSIAEAARAADAMERLAKSSFENLSTVKDVTSKQMRAYLTVVIGSAVFQERGKNLKFEAKPLIINTGNTPAHKVAFRAKAAILPAKLPPNFDLNLQQDFNGAGVIGPHQNMIIGAVLDEFVEDASVNEIKRGSKPDGSALNIWGTVTYEDIFGVPHMSNFFHTYTWVGLEDKEQILGYFRTEHNEAT